MKRFLGVGLLLLVTSIAAAQDQPRGGRGGFGGGFGGGGPGGGGATLILSISEVQKELNITDEQKKKITELGEASRKEMQASFGSFNREEFDKLSDDEKAKRRTEMSKKAEDAGKKALADVAKILDEKQNERFGQLRLQRTGISALAQDDVASKLGLSGEQREEVAKIIQAGRPMGFGGFGGSEEERRAAFEKMQKAREKSQSDLMAVLTPEQKAKWEGMLGKKFEFPNRGFGPPGGGQGAGQGGQGGGRRRPE